MTTQAGDRAGLTFEEFLRFEAAYVGDSFEAAYVGDEPFELRGGTHPVEIDFGRPWNQADDGVTPG